MEQKQEYERIPPREKQKLSKQLAGLLFLHRYAKIWDGNNCTTAQVIHWCEKCIPLGDNIMDAWLRWKGYIAGKKGHNSTHWITWYRSELGEIFRSFYTCCCCPDSVKDASRIYLNAVKQLYWENSLDDSNELCRMNRSDWEKLEIATTIVFFRQWMQTQPQMRQSIYDFARNPFGTPIPEAQLLRCDEYGISFLDRRYKSLVNAHDSICIMQEMGRIQHEREIHNNVHTEGQLQNGYMIPYTHLCAMEFIAEFKSDRPTADRDTSCFRIFKYISQRKEVFRTPSDKQSYTKIANACEDYTTVLDLISQWGEKSNTGAIANPKRYVIGSMMAIELEEAYRLHLASAAASVSHKNRIKGRVTDRKSTEGSALQIILGRMPFNTVVMDNRSSDYYQCNLASISAHNILNYSIDLKYCYSAPSKQCQTYTEKTILLRAEQLDLLFVLWGIFKDQLQNAWSDTDFERIAEFLYSEYNVIDYLRAIRFPAAGNSEKSQKECKKHYNEMRKFYEMILSWKGNTINQPYLDYKKITNSRKN